MPHFGHSQTLVWFVSAVISFGAAAGAASVPEGVAVLASPAFCADFGAAWHPASARTASIAKRIRFIVHSGWRPTWRYFRYLRNMLSIAAHDFLSASAL